MTLRRMQLPLESPCAPLFLMVDVEACSLIAHEHVAASKQVLHFPVMPTMQFSNPSGLCPLLKQKSLNTLLR